MGPTVASGEVRQRYVASFVAFIALDTNPTTSEVLVFFFGLCREKCTRRAPWRVSDEQQLEKRSLTSLFLCILQKIALYKTILTPRVKILRFLVRVEESVPLPQGQNVSALFRLRSISS